MVTQNPACAASPVFFSKLHYRLRKSLWNFLQIWLNTGAGFTFDLMARPSNAPKVKTATSRWFCDATAEVVRVVQIGVLEFPGENNSTKSASLWCYGDIIRPSVSAGSTLEWSEDR